MLLQINNIIKNNIIAPCSVFYIEFDLSCCLVNRIQVKQPWRNNLRCQFEIRKPQSKTLELSFLFFYQNRIIVSESVTIQIYVVIKVFRKNVSTINNKQ